MKQACDVENVFFDLQMVSNPIEFDSIDTKITRNIEIGWGMDALVRIVADHVPTNDQNVKRVIKITERREHPAKPPELSAVVHVGKLRDEKCYCVLLVSHQVGVIADRQLATKEKVVAESDGFNYSVCTFCVGQGDARRIAHGSIHAKLPEPQEPALA
jgi:hypothetical protein